VPQPVAKIGSQEILQQLVAQIPWGHNVLLMEKVKDLPTRLWYIEGRQEGTTDDSKREEKVEEGEEKKVGCIQPFQESC